MAKKKSAAEEPELDLEELTPEEIEQKEKAEGDLVEFIRLMWPVLEPSTKLVEGWVLYAICDYLMAAADGHIKRGLINVFPGSMKSLAMNVFFCAWLWGPKAKPHLRFICASYDNGLPERDNGRFMRLIKDSLYQKFWGEHFSLTKESMSWIENDKTGWKRTTSTHSATSGHRGDMMLIDDANDPNNVESPLVREATVKWIREIMPDRLNNLDEGIIINLQQRVHASDATGILATYGEGYPENWLMIPMEFDPLRSTPVVMRRDEDGSPSEIWVDPRGVDKDGNELEGIVLDKDGKRVIRPNSPMAKAEGSLAWPERFSPEACAALKKLKAEYAWSGQYMQSPSPRGGGIIRDEWWLPWPKKQFPDMTTVILSLVPAFSEDEEDKYHSATVWGAFDEPDSGRPMLMLVNSWMDRAPLAQLVTRIGELASKHKADYVLLQKIETKPNPVLNEMLKLYSDASWNTVIVPVDGTPYSRLQAVSALFSGDVKKMPVLTPRGEVQQFTDIWTGGMIHAPNTDWADEVITAVSNYPRGSNVNLVDSVSQALSWSRKWGVVIRKAEYDVQKIEALKFTPSQKVPYSI